MTSHRLSPPSTPPRLAWLARSTAILLLVGGAAACGDHKGTDNSAQIAAGKQTFRFDTFGDETKWTDTLRLHEVVGTITPAQALAVGLKVDSAALPPAVVDGINNGTVSLQDPATTLALLKLDAVVGVKGTVESVGGHDTLTRIGITCALCHSTVDDSFTHGVGKRLDGWPNHDLNVGAIVALSPVLDQATKDVFNSWGPGKYDPRFNQDGLNGPAVIPPAYGLEGVHKVTVTGDGDDLMYWNRYVAVTQMGGHGSFDEDRTRVHVRNGTDDQVSSKLPDLQAYQLSLPAPPPPTNSFDAAAAARGQALFAGKAACATCHSGPQFTDANIRLHPASDSIGEPELNGEPSYASRSATKQYRTAPLRGVWQHPPYFHNGKFATLSQVVDEYNSRRTLNLTDPEKTDLVEYLKSL
jgi:hypothetical protein